MDRKAYPEDPTIDGGHQAKEQKHRKSNPNAQKVMWTS